MFEGIDYESILEKCNNAPLREIVTELIETNIVLLKDLNYILSNLDSDNLKRIDFSHTKVAKCERADIATRTWVEEIIGGNQ